MDSCLLIMKVLHESVYIEWSLFCAYFALDPLFTIYPANFLTFSFCMYISNFRNMHASSN